MKSNVRGLIVRVLTVVALGMFVTVPAVSVTAQDWGWGRDDRDERRQDRRDERMLVPSERPARGLDLGGQAARRASPTQLASQTLTS